MVAAGRKQPYPWTAGKQSLGQLGTRVDHVLAVVEHEQKLTGLEICDHRVGQGFAGAFAAAEDGCNRVRQQVRRLDRRQLHQPHTVYIVTKGGPGTSTQTISYYIYLNGLQFFRVGYGAATGVLLAVVTIVFARYYLGLMRGAR